MTGPSGKYRLDQRLGGGGMAEVFLGSSVGAEGFSRRVAIKRVLPGYSQNPQFARMFVAEAQISSRLVHPNIVSVLDFDRDPDGSLFLVMELVEGRDLDALLATGPLPLPIIIYVIAEVLRGLGHAHDLPVGTDMRGVVHRDVSPHNVLLSWDGSVKVSDFGIAKARSASNATASEFIKGKPAYMSPEQANGEALDGRSDLFAVGIMLWEMLVGRRLFTGEDTRATLAAVLFGQVPRPRTLRADAPKDLERVVMKLLERDVNQRYPTAEAAIDELLECANAPKNGRELLAHVLAERFPQAAPVRQSRLHSHASGQTPHLGGAATPAPYPSAGGAYGTPTQDTNRAVPVHSLGGMMSAPTGTMQPHSAAMIPGQRTRGAKLGIAAAASVAVAAVTFAILSATVLRHHAGSASASSSGSGSGTGSAAVIAAATVIDAGAPPPPPVVDAAPPAPPADAGPVTPDAVPPIDHGKKDDSGAKNAHPGSDKKLGRLHAIGDPIRTVYVDGKYVGDMPLDKQIPVGRHAVRLVNTDEGIDEHLSITITENATTTIDRTH